MKLGDPKTVGEMMRARRLQLGFTQAEFAEATGVSPITIMRLELGRVSFIHEKTAKALEVPKKIGKRMVLEQVAVMHNGDTVPVTLPPLSTMRKKPAISSQGGDIEALPAARAPRQQSELRGQAHVASPLKKVLLWLAQKV